MKPNYMKYRLHLSLPFSTSNILVLPLKRLAPDIKCILYNVAFPGVLFSSKNVYERTIPVNEMWRKYILSSSARKSRLCVSP
jgi:hypothetical protein